MSMGEPPPEQHQPILRFEETTYDASSEMRFAVVLYGGVSLAIYMNGIVKELFDLVRSTAPSLDPPADDSSPSAMHISDADLEKAGAGSVYRKMARRLDRAEKSHDHGSVQTRFVVDLITGTSAGGINGVFLAKALANDLSLDPLSKLWIEEGDIGLLLNDDQATKGIDGLTPEDPPESLLSGQRMLYKLLDATTQVSGSRKPTQPSPYVTALDLWVTATDLRGRAEPIPLDSAQPDRKTYELGHRKTFHFMYEEVLGDGSGGPPVQPDDPDASPPAMTAPFNAFGSDYDPLLAFAARCTSSFPGAFEPVRLDDLAPVVKAIQSNGQVDLSRWKPDADCVKPFFQEYGEDLTSYLDVCFADGGYLDNHPVDLILNTLPKRRAAIPVNRRVLLVDPDPGGEPTPGTTPPAERVDLVATVTKVLTLPRSQTIGADVARIKALAAPAEVRAAIYKAVRAALDAKAPVVPVVDDPQAAVKPVDPPADRATAAPAPASPEPVNPPPPSLPAIAYASLRHQQICADLAATLARVAYPDRAFDIDSPQYLAAAGLVERWHSNLSRPVDAPPNDIADALLDGADLSYSLRRINFIQWRIDEEMREPEVAREDVLAGRRKRRALDVEFQRLALVGRRLRTRDKNPAQASIEALRPLMTDAAVDTSKDQARFTLLTQILTTFGARIAASRPADEAGFYERLLADADLVRDWSRFEEYDEATFAIQDALGGESSSVDVVRFSPRDATALFNEQTAGRKKLAGAQVHHFGGFFSADWRRCDILWGRLDAAEGIVRTIWPASDPSGQADYIRKAQARIIDDALTDRDYRRLLSVLVPSLRPERPSGSAARAHEASLVLDAMSDYTPPPPPDRETDVQLAARTSKIAARLGDGLSQDAAAPLKAVSAWVGRVLTVVAGVINVAVPSTSFGYVAAHLVDLSVFAALLVIVVGAVFTHAGAVSFGWELLAAAVGLKLLVATLRAWISRTRWWAALIVGMLAFAGFAIYDALSDSGTNRIAGLGIGAALGLALGSLAVSRRKVAGKQTVNRAAIATLALAVVVIVVTGILGVVHGRDRIKAAACDQVYSWWERPTRSALAITCPTAATPTAAEQRVAR